MGHYLLTGQGLALGKGACHLGHGLVDYRMHQQLTEVTERIVANLFDLSGLKSAGIFPLFGKMLHHQ